MANEPPSNPELEIGHVLVMDIIGYSKLLIHQQSDLLRRLNEIVRRTEQFRAADAQGKLIRLPTGDGMALVFFGDPKAPIECATEIATALTSHPDIQLRMGIHSGPVNEVLDVNERTNVAGAGIDIAQRVMDCGDAGHILLSKRVADDLAPYSRWNPHLHELGECEVKHGRKISLVNFCTAEVGNPNPPKKCATQQISRRLTSPLLVSVALLLLLALGLVIFRVAGTARRIAHKQTDATAGRSDAPSVPAKSIAVLPFQNLSRDPDNAFFADGVQDEILTNLARIADLKVISRTSVMQYKTGVARNLREIAQQLGVAHVVEGSVQRVSNRVRVNRTLHVGQKLLRLLAPGAHLPAENRLTVFAAEIDGHLLAMQIDSKVQHRKVLLGLQTFWRSSRHAAFPLYPGGPLFHGISHWRSGKDSPKLSGTIQSIFSQICFLHARRASQRFSDRKRMIAKRITAHAAKRKAQAIGLLAARTRRVIRLPEAMTPF